MVDEPTGRGGPATMTEWSLGAAGGFEAAFPVQVPGLAVAHVGGPGDGFDEGSVDLIARRPEGPRHVHEQHDPDPVGVVPSEVLVAVVEQQALALLPMGDLPADVN